jgi:hypothetical protein
MALEPRFRFVPSSSGDRLRRFLLEVLHPTLESHGKRAGGGWEGHGAEHFRLIMGKWVLLVYTEEGCTDDDIIHLHLTEDIAIARGRTITLYSSRGQGYYGPVSESAEWLGTHVLPAWVENSYAESEEKTDAALGALSLGGC